MNFWLSAFFGAIGDTGLRRLERVERKQDMLNWCSVCDKDTYLLPTLPLNTFHIDGERGLKEEKKGKERLWF